MISAWLFFENKLRQIYRVGLKIWHFITTTNDIGDLGCVIQRQNHLGNIIAKLIFKHLHIIFAAFA